MLVVLEFSGMLSKAAIPSYATTPPSKRKKFMSVSFPQHLRRSMKHLVRGTLGLRYASGRTVFLGAVFVLFGMGIGPTALEHLIDWVLLPSQEPNRGWSFVWLLLSLVVLVVLVLFSYGLDRRFFLDEKEKKVRYTETKRAIVMAPSWGYPMDIFLNHLEELQRKNYLEELAFFRPGNSLPEGHPLAVVEKAELEKQQSSKRRKTPLAPGWMELLARIIEHHHGAGQTPKIERVVLLLDRARCGTEGEEPAIRRAAELLLAIVGQKHGVVKVCALDDINDVEDVRKKTLAVLAEIDEETDIHLYETAVDITGGTVAASVGMTLAASELDVDVQYFSQRPAPKPGEICDDFGYLPEFLGEKGTWGLTPIRVFTDAHRRQLAED